VEQPNNQWNWAASERGSYFHVPWMENIANYALSLCLPETIKQNPFHSRKVQTFNCIRICLISLAIERGEERKRKQITHFLFFFWSSKTIDLHKELFLNHQTPIFSNMKGASGIRNICTFHQSSHENVSVIFIFSSKFIFNQCRLKEKKRISVYDEQSTTIILCVWKRIIFCIVFDGDRWAYTWSLSINSMWWAKSVANTAFRNNLRNRRSSSQVKPFKISSFSIRVNP
jgi:hypothetical protein